MDRCLELCKQEASKGRPQIALVWDETRRDETEPTRAEEDEEQHITGLTTGPDPDR